MGKYLTLSFHKICIIIQGPLPRAACAASPSPSCSGKRPKVERWRGVNGLANYSRTVVSAPRPPTTRKCILK